MLAVASPAVSPADQGSFAALDWAVVGVYLIVVFLIGLLAGRMPGRTASRQTGRDEFLLAGRSMPMWAVAISILATSQSAATFVGGPEQSFRGNLTYLMGQLGQLIAVILVAWIFIPRYYRANVTSVYELIGHACGTVAQRCSSGMFILGRILASGARLFIVAIPFAMIAFGDVSPQTMTLSILIVATAATVYTLVGGIRAVIWTDVLQAVVYIGAVFIALIALWLMIPADTGEIVAALQSDPDGSKLKILDFSFNSTYGLPAILIGLTLFNLAAFGADQDLTQRMLTCKTPQEGSKSVILATIIGWPVVAVFMLMGTLLYVYYAQPELMGAAAPAAAPDYTPKVFLTFILTEMPIGVRGLMLAGLFAAAMSSMDSALNALASSAVADFYRPWREMREGRVHRGDMREMRFSRFAVLCFAGVLATVAVACVRIHASSDESLIDFALGIMVFAYGGLLGVFFTAMFTRRGSPVSVAAALILGMLTVIALQPDLWKPLALRLGLEVQDVGYVVAFPWRMTAATIVSFIICCLGSRAPRVLGVAPRRA